MSPVATPSSQGKGRGSVGDVVAELSEAIRGGELRFGDPLPAERTLAAQLDVSRTTLRKGIRILADAGVLEIRSGVGSKSGTVVRSELVPAELLGRPAPPIGEISGVLQARRLLEPRRHVDGVADESDGSAAGDDPADGAGAQGGPAA